MILINYMDLVDYIYENKLLIKSYQNMKPSLAT